MKLYSAFPVAIIISMYSVVISLMLRKNREVSEVMSVESFDLSTAQAVCVLMVLVTCIVFIFLFIDWYITCPTERKKDNDK